MLFCLTSHLIHQAIVIDIAYYSLGYSVKSFLGKVVQCMIIRAAEDR